MLSDQRRQNTLIPALGVLWASGILLAKVAVSHGIPPLAFATFEALGIAATSTAISAWRRDFPAWDRPSLSFYGITAVTLVILPYSFIYTALEHITGSLASIVQAMTPVFTLVLAVLIGLERSTIPRWLGVLLSFAGIVVVVLAQSRDTGAGFSGWAVLALLAPVSYAVTNIYAARVQDAQSSVARAAGSNLVAAGGMILVLCAATALDPAALHVAAIPAPVIGAGLLAVAANVGASLAFFRLATLGGATKAGLASYITVLVGMVAGWLALAEPVTIVAAVAAAVVVAGVALAARTPRNRDRDPDRDEQPTPEPVSET